MKEKSPHIKVNAVFTSVLIPFPTEIGQADSQFVKFIDNHYFLSPYRTDTQKTTIKLASSNIKSFTKMQPSSARGSVLSFGPYNMIKPFDSSNLIVHYANNKPFAKFSTVAREVEVSHWGNVFFEDIYELKHAGAKLKGGFSRFDFQTRRSSAPTPAFSSLHAQLPRGAQEIYYRDQIGNISTSDLTFAIDSVGLDIETRFPIFGGWQTQFYIGYSVPSNTGVLFVKPDESNDSTSRFKLTFDFFPSFDDVWVEEMEIKVVLPEGCYDIKVDSPFPVDTQETRRFTYLDSQLNGGRPVIIMKAYNLVDEHALPLSVSYSFSKPRMLVEPLMLVGSVFCFFLFCSLLSRLDLKLGGKENVSTM